MQNIIEYENRDQLYSFLINDFGLVKIDEEYDFDAFGKDAERKKVLHLKESSVLSSTIWLSENE